MITLVVLAAGMGSRYGGLKQMDGMGPNGETILDYSVYDAIRAGFQKVTFIIRRDFAEDFQRRAEERYGNRIGISYAYQELDDLPVGFTCPPERKKPWGTAHAIWVARNVVNTPFAVINADDYYGPSAFQTAAGYLNTVETTSTNYGMVAYELENTLSSHGGVNRGVIKQSKEYLQSVQEILKIEADEEGLITGVDDDGLSYSLEKTTLVSMNYFLFTPALFAQLERFLVDFFASRLTEEKSESYIPAVVDELIQNGEATCQVTSSADQWFGVTYPEDKAVVQDAIHQCIKKGIYPNTL